MICTGVPTQYANAYRWLDKKEKEREVEGALEGRRKEEGRGKKMKSKKKKDEEKSSDSVLGKHQH